MEKRYLSPLELLSLATQHAHAAEYLLRKATKETLRGDESLDDMAPITSLMYLAFQLTFKAYSLHEQRPIKEYKRLMELVELNTHLGFSSRELFLFKILAKQQVFSKGINYDLWENRQKLHLFCEEIMSLYEKLQKVMPIELQDDFQ